MTPFEELTMRMLLSQRFDDGSIHVRSRQDRILLKRARRMGLVDTQDRLTDAGTRFRQAGPISSASLTPDPHATAASR